MAKLLHSKTFIVFLVIVLIIVIIGLGRESYRYFRVNQEIKNLENKIANLEGRNEELLKMEEYFHSDEFLEREARLKLNLIKPGEKLIIIKQSGEINEEKNEKIVAEEISNVQKWWNYFFGEKL